MNVKSFQKRIEPVSIEFKDSNTPYSAQFQDIYYTPETGIEESTYVYLRGSGFIDSLEKNPDQSHFTIGEVGFGVGLNFLLTYQYFFEHASPHQKLTYISAEKHPVLKKDLEKLYSVFPEMKKYSDELLDHYPVLTPGVHTLNLANGRLKLILLLGDAELMFSNLPIPTHQKIEFWYWDGFAPQRNPEAFKISLFESLIPISAPNARAASFTAAGWVRRGLEDAGFRVEKRAGFHLKRECIVVQFPEIEEKKSKAPWFSAQNLVTLKKGDRVAVIGAGLSGTAIARALADRGFKVTLIEQDSIAAHASGNPAGLYGFQMSRIPNPISRFSQHSLLHLIREIKSRSVPTRKGILRMDAVQNKEDFDLALATSEYPGEFYEYREDGIYFPECGILSPKKLCEIRANHPLIELKKEKVTWIEKHNGIFNLKNPEQLTIEKCEHVVYASGSSLILDYTIEHSHLKNLPLKAVRGQIIQVTPTEESKKIPYTLQDSGYLLPVAIEITGIDTQCIGATYQAKTILPHQEKLDSISMIEEARKKHPAFATLQENQLVSARVGYRLSTPDKLPMIGPLCDPEKLSDLYGKSLRDGFYRDLPELVSETGEWLFLGMSSRGITFTSYGAELLASLMCGEIIPIEADLWEHLHSARFIVRKLKKS